MTETGEHAMTNTVVELGPLPPPALVDVNAVDDVGEYRFWTASQMREYASASVLAHLFNRNLCTDIRSAMQAVLDVEAKP